MNDKIKIKLSKVAEFLGGEHHGADVEISGICVPEEQREGAICMISDKSKVSLVDSGAASAYIIDKKLDLKTNKPYIAVENTREALVKILRALSPDVPVKRDISKCAVVHKKAKLAKNVEIGNFVSIGEGAEIANNTRVLANSVVGKNVKIGENCIIYPNVVIYDNCEIGNNVILHSGAIIGADGFGFIPANNPIKIPQLGKVIIEDYVELGANTCVDRATIGSTVVGFGSKLDNLINIGHNTKVGKACLFASQVGISGSCEIADGVILAGQVGISDHVKIAKGVILGGQCGVSNDVKEKGLHMGSPSMPFTKFARSQAVFEDLPNLKKRVINLEKQINGN